MMVFFTNLFANAFTDPRTKYLEEKINNAETDEEREMYENELNDQHSTMIHYWG
jgi:hypothetical protein